MEQNRSKSFFQREDLFFSLLVTFFLFFFYPDLFLARSGSLTGDHFFQHYPWAYLLFESLKRLELPFWTPLVHCGFPLVAEGQIGAFYPINLILLIFLPFQWAYSYMNCVHFIIAGLGMYFYLRQVKLEPFSTFVASFIYLFGAAYGGAYYNITSLKTLSWFPWMLFLFERFIQRDRMKDLVILSLISAMALLAGYLQIAILAIFMFFLYSVFRLFWLRDQNEINFSGQGRKCLFILLALLASGIVAFPQLFLTFRLASFSNRVNLVEDYAYVGSMSPLALLTLAYPALTSVFRGNNLYLGIPSIFLIICALSAKEVRKKIFVKIWIILGLIAFLLALGEWSPLYIVLIKISHFYSFRTPAKFLFFICFAGAVLSGYGFQLLSSIKQTKQLSQTIDKSISRFVGFVCLSLFFFCAICSFINLAIFRQPLIDLGNWFISNFVYGRAGHPHSLESYQGRLLDFLDSAKTIFDLGRFWIGWTHAMMALSLASCLWFFKKKRGLSLWILFVVLFVDLYGISFFDIKRDFAKYNEYISSNIIIDELRQERELKKIARIHTFTRYGKVPPLTASSNMLYGLEHTGIYSPFVSARYYESVGRLGGVNDSNAVFTPEISFILQRLHWFDFLNVSHVITSEQIKHSQLELRKKDTGNGAYLYRNRGNYAKIHLITEYELFDDWASIKNRMMEPFFDPNRILLIEKSDASLSGLAPYDSKGEKLKFKINDEQTDVNVRSWNVEAWNVEVSRDCFFVISDLSYPGWAVTFNEKPVQILRAFGLFRAVRLPKAGIYKIKFHYKPYS